MKELESSNLALGERRANAAKDYLMIYEISGKELPLSVMVRKAC